MFCFFLFGFFKDKKSDMKNSKIVMKTRLKELKVPKIKATIPKVEKMQYIRRRIKKINIYNLPPAEDIWEEIRPNN